MVWTTAVVIKKDEKPHVDNFTAHANVQHTGKRKKEEKKPFKKCRTNSKAITVKFSEIKWLSPTDLPC